MICRKRSVDTVLTRQILKLGLVLAVLTGSAAGQSWTSTDGTTPLGIAPGSPAGSFALSDFETINAYNGNLNFALPLLRIGGRGSAGYTMTRTINQRWTVRHEFFNQSYFMHYPGEAWWRPNPGYSPGLVLGRTVGEGSCVSGGPVMSGSLTRLTFATPDGTEIELIDKVLHGAPTSIYCYGGNGMGQSRGHYWVTTDGSATTFVSDTAIHDQITTHYTFTPSGYLLFRDGTRYRIDSGRVSWIRDSNGNKVTLTYDLQYGPTYGKVIKVIDSLNREVNISYNVSDPTYGSHDQITYKGFGGQSRTIRVAYQPLNQTLRADQTIKTWGELFGLYDFGGLNFDTTTVSSVWLPDGRRFRMYYNSYAEVARVEFPTGGAFEYDWGASMLNGDPKGIVLVQTTFDGMHEWMPEIYRRVLTKRMYPNGASGNDFETKIVFGQTQGQGTATSSTSVGTYDSAGHLLALQKHYFHGNPIPDWAMGIFEHPGWGEGKEYQTEHFDIVGGNPVLVRRLNNTWMPSGTWQVNPRITETVSTLIETNQVSRQAFFYDQFNNRTDVYEYDFGSGTPGDLVRHTHTDFLVINPVNQVDYTRDDIGVHRRDLPILQQVFDGTPTEKARVTYEYDKYDGDNFHAALIDRPAITGHDSAFSPVYTARGNVTAITNYRLGSPTTEISAYSHYDIAGNRVKSIDARSTSTNIIATIFEYDDKFGPPDGNTQSNDPPSEITGLTTYAFATKITNPLGHTAFGQFDYHLGAPVDTADINGVVTSRYFNDLIGRQTQVRQALGNAAANQITFSYDDATRTITSTSDLNTYGDNVVKTQTLYDGLGRTTETRQYEDGSNFIATKQVPFAVIQDGNNWRTATQTSSPHRPPLEQPDWTTSISDSLGRVIKVRTADNAEVIAAFSGNRSLMSDPAGKRRIARMDALGRMTDLWEVTALDDATEAISFPGFADVVQGYRTSYSYDTLDNLVTVNQGSQTRTFVYDSLKRLTSADNPESGTVSYQYDNNGSLLVKTDPRGVSVHYEYDALNRVFRRWYNSSSLVASTTHNNPALPSGVGASEEVNYGYDSGCPTCNTKGKLVSVSSSVSTYSYSSYDALGHALNATQTLGAQSYTMTYSYDLAGHVKTMGYPSGRTVTNDYDNAGRLSSFTGNLGDGGAPRTYASDISYSPFGGVKWEKYGTAIPLYQKTFYNIRGQVFDKRLSSVNDTWDWNRGRLILYYSSNHVWGGSGTDNNGNVRFAEHWIPPPNATLDQAQYLIEDSFTYDSLNRLEAVTESTLDIAGGGSWTPRFVQAYTYDRYGNRTITNDTTGLTQHNYAVSPFSNKLYGPGESDQSHSLIDYDAAGNQKKDYYTDNAIGRFYDRAYDAENRMKTSTDGAVTSVYSYDGDSRRVKRLIGSTETWQVYGVGGELIAEYAANDPYSNPQKEYGYRNGELLITASATSGWGAPPTIADNPLMDPQNPESFTIKAIHITQLRDAINALRAHHSLSNYPWQKPTASGGAIDTSVFISWEPIDEMRTALNQALGAPPNGYAAGLAQGQPILAVHIQELRDRVLNAWQGGGGIDIRWLVPDHLGTPRMVFDQTGSLANVSRHDYLPFGEELFANTGGRTAGMGYTQNDNLRQKFTLYERDLETGLDFAEGRYLSSFQGRFVSADPLIASARRQTPQSWNRYSYVINNPLVYIDPSGEAWIRGPNGQTGWDKDIHNEKDLRKKYGPGWQIIDGRQGVIYETSPRSGFIVGHLYTFHATGGVTDHGVYSPPPPPRVDTRYGDEMALAVIKLYASAAFTGATGGTSLLAVTLGSASVASDFLLPEDAPDPQTATMAAGTTVYISYAPNGKPEYIGITDDFARRAGEHLRDGRVVRPVPGLENLTREQARAVEQSLIERYGFRRDAGSLSNIRNSISPRRADYKAAVRRGLQIIKRAKIK